MYWFSKLEEEGARLRRFFISEQMIDWWAVSTSGRCNYFDFSKISIKLKELNKMGIIK